jgi:sec-independent protein translocase protein TatB
MFDFAWSELALIGVVALIVIGPKDLPRVLRTVGKWVHQARAIAREFQGSLDQMIREAELEDVKREIQKATSLDLEKEFQNTIDPKGELTSALNDPTLANPLADTPKPASLPAAESSEAAAALPAPGTEPAGTAAEAAAPAEAPPVEGTVAEAAPPAPTAEELAAQEAKAAAEKAAAEKAAQIAANAAAAGPGPGPNMVPWPPPWLADIKPPPPAPELAPPADLAPETAPPADDAASAPPAKSGTHD